VCAMFRSLSHIGCPVRGSLLLRAAAQFPLLSENSVVIINHAPQSAASPSPSTWRVACGPRILHDASMSCEFLAPHACSSSLLGLWLACAIVADNLNRNNNGSRGQAGD
jgi:hypothetical protein